MSTTCTPKSRSPRSRISHNRLGSAHAKQLGGVSAGLYVGGKGTHGTSDPTQLVDDRNVLRKSPPDILLTNYRMLDFLLMRPEDAELWAQAPESDVAQANGRAPTVAQAEPRAPAVAPGVPGGGGHDRQRQPTCSRPLSLPLAVTRGRRDSNPAVRCSRLP